MNKIISTVAVAPIRSEPSHRSEQVTQLLFGEAAVVHDEVKDFLKIKCVYDGYEGWCQATQVAEVTDEQALVKDDLLAAGWINEIKINNQPAKISFGSSLSFNSKGKVTGKHFEATYDGEIWNPANALFNEETITMLAYKYLNTSYQWGGRSVFGIDCSGFSQMVFRFMNIALLRDASQQATQGEGIGFLQESTCGDLAFFDNDEGKINHVGILLNPSTIIHSSGKVRVDLIDNAGIINADTGLRTHHLRLIKRMVNRGF